MILHLASDEKFINSARELFEAVAPGNNHFIIYKDDPEQPCIHVSPANGTQRGPCDAGKTAALIDNWENVQALVIHMLTPFSAETLLSSKHRFPVLWLAWGCDVYNATPTLEWRLYQPQTLQYFSSNGSHRPIWYAKAIIRCILQKTGIYGNRRDRNHFRAIKACTFCAPVFPSEEAAIRKHCNFKGRFLRFSYGDYASENTSPGPESARQKISWLETPVRQHQISLMFFNCCSGCIWGVGR